MFYTALAGHALEWKLIIGALQISISDILTDIIGAFWNFVPLRTMWFGSRKGHFGCLHDYCRSQNRSGTLPFSNFREFAAHFQHHMKQHSGHCSAGSSSQPNLSTNPVYTAPHTAITIIPEISQDQDLSQLTTHLTGPTNSSVSGETHVLDICFPEKRDMHHLDELEFQTEWNDSVLLWKLKMKFQNKQRHARYLPWWLFHLKRLQRVNVKKVGEKWVT